MNAYPTAAFGVNGLGQIVGGYVVGGVEYGFIGTPTLTQFWDGVAMTGDGAMHGGSGIWNNSATNWTTSDGATNTSWQGGKAVFEGMAGTVTIAQAVSYQGLQFSTTGYVMTAAAGGVLAPSGVAPVVVDDGLAATISAPITGSGGLHKTGRGTLILSGLNTYSSGTLISAGTLQVTNNSSVGTGIVTLDGGAFRSGAPGLVFTTAFDINTIGGTIDTKANTLTLAGTIGNGNGATGVLTKLGAGALVLSATNAYTGPTEVNSGTLDVTGSIASSSLTSVASGATLTGSGAVGALQIISGGVFAPGSGAARSSTSVYGTLVFDGSATYQVQASATAMSFAKVSGAASLAGAILADFASGASLTKQYTILTAAGGLGGTTFASLANINLPAGITDFLTYDADDVYLNLKATLAQAPTNRLNVNQLNVANALNGAFNRGASLSSAFVNVFGLTGAGLANGLSQLSGEAAVGAQQGAFQFTNSFLSLLLDPYAENRGSFRGSGFGPALSYAGDPQTPSAISSAFSDLIKQAPAGLTYERAWTVWGAAFGGGEQVGGNAALGSHNTSSGTGSGVVGADYHVSPDAMLGFAIAYGGMSWSTSGLGGGRSDVFQAGLYAVDELGPAYVAGAVSLGDYWVTTNRSVTLPDGGVFSANFNAQGFGGRLESGYHIALAPFTLTPYGALQAQNFRTPSYSESAASGATALSLNYASQTASDTRLELGAWADKAIISRDGNVLVKLFVRAAWVHDWETNPTLQASFIGLPTAGFTVNGAREAHDQALVTAGAEWRLSKNWTAVAKFEGEFGKETQIYAATGRISYSW